MKLCAWNMAKLKQHDADFMAEIQKLNPKPKVGAISMASPSTGASSDVQAQVQVKSEHANPSVATDNGQMTLKWSVMPPEERKKRLADAHDAWDMFFFVNNVPFSLISSPKFTVARVAERVRKKTFEPAMSDPGVAPALAAEAAFRQRSGTPVPVPRRYRRHVHTGRCPLCSIDQSTGFSSSVTSSSTRHRKDANRR